MNKLALLQRYQSFNPITGRFDCPRTNREYASLLGVHESTLSKLYSGQEPVGLKSLEGLARVFPQARKIIGDALAAPEAETASVA